MANGFLKKVLRNRLTRAAMATFSKLPDERTNRLRVLTYHRVANLSEQPDLDPHLISATPADFERQMQWLTRDYHLVDLAQVQCAFDGTAELPPRSVLITFDDAYQDFELNAWPILNRLKIRPALFVPTAFPGSQLSFWWDRLYSLIQTLSLNQSFTVFGEVYSCQSESDRWPLFRKLRSQFKRLGPEEIQSALHSIDQDGTSLGQATNNPVLNWDQLRRLSKEGVDIVPHTSTHPLLNQLTAAESLREIVESRDKIADEIGLSIPAFAYPAGNFTANVTKQLRDNGFKMAFTTIRGVNDLGSCDSLRIRRCNVSQNTSDELIRLQLNSCSQIFLPSIPSSVPMSAH